MGNLYSSKEGTMKPKQIVLPTRMDWKFVLTLIATLKLIRPKVIVITSICITSINKVKKGKTYNFRAVITGYQKEDRKPVLEFKMTFDHIDDCTWWPVENR
jgi:hypothetical protein